MPVAEVNGISISYAVEGTGEPLVMIMGFTADRHGWDSQVRFFKKEYKIILFDNRGAGKSDKPQGPYTTRMMADDAAGLLDSLKIRKAHVMGASMGGMIAQELAINYPERVNKLVLACTYACQDGTSGDAPEQARLANLRPEKMTTAMIGLAFNKPIYRLTYGIAGMIGSRFVGASGRVGIAGQLAACRSHNTLERLSRITSPTLVIVGTKDRIISPVSSEVIASKIPNAELIKIGGGSHSFTIEMKDRFNREVSGFLQK